jgi:hypothetical protein
MKTILIIEAFINDESDETTLNNFINSSRNIGGDILLMSNTNISKTIQDNVDYFFYDKRNQLFKEKYDNYKDINYYNLYDNFKVSNIFPYTQPHALSVLISLFRSVKIAKDLGYTHFYKMEYDARLGINTTAPTELLDVNGNIKCTGTITNGSNSYIYAGGLRLGGFDTGNTLWQNSGNLGISANTGNMNMFRENTLIQQQEQQPGDVNAMLVNARKASKEEYVEITDVPDFSHLVKKMNL